MRTPPHAVAAARFAADGDQVLFAERDAGRAAGLRRSKSRAAGLAAYLDIDLPSVTARADHTIAVTGSKGKGTAAAYASATLAAAGLRVGTLTSPGLRSNRERIRVDGAAIGPDDYRVLVLRVRDALRASERALPDDGYLSPTGLFTLMAVRHFLDKGCDAWVLEAGMGGASDEVSLFAAGVVVLTSVFAEHLGVLGGSIAEIARDKLGAASTHTRAIVSAEQHEAEVRTQLERSTVPVQVVDAAPVQGVAWPGELIGDNARVGVAAALRLLDATRAVDLGVLRTTLQSVNLPGRMSIHHRDGQRWLVDAATNTVAAHAALRWADGLAPRAVTLVCIPDGKDIAGVRGALAGREVIALRSDAPHLSFSGWDVRLPALGEIDSGVLGPDIMALGTVHFVGDVMELLDVDTERLFVPPTSASD